MCRFSQVDFWNFGHQSYFWRNMADNSLGFTELTGYSVQEIVGRNCRFLLNGVPSNLIDVGQLRGSQRRIWCALGWFDVGSFGPFQSFVSGLPELWPLNKHVFTVLILIPMRRGGKPQNSHVPSTACLATCSFDTKDTTRVKCRASAAWVLVGSKTGAFLIWSAIPVKLGTSWNNSEDFSNRLKFCWQVNWPTFWPNFDVQVAV